MKSFRLLIISSLFCMLCLCAEKGFFFSAIENGNYSAVRNYQQQVTLQDSVADYIRTVRSNCFTVANSVTNVAERVPVQRLGAGRGTNIQGRYCCCGFRKKTQLSGSSGAIVPYHNIVPVLNCGHFSKCYILALCRLLC